eukprot:359674-Hanusia_phi.AAC.1
MSFQVHTPTPSYTSVLKSQTSVSWIGDSTVVNHRTKECTARRFLSPCMEEIEPKMELRGKETMYECCYCGKWCTVSGTRALSKHIENDHRPQVSSPPLLHPISSSQSMQVILKMNVNMQHLSKKLRAGESQLAFVSFTPLQLWNVEIEVAVSSPSGALPSWVTLQPLYSIGEYRQHLCFGSVLQLKLRSALPYLPRPKWDEAVHAKQRVVMNVSSCRREVFAKDESSWFAPSCAFMIRFQAPKELENDVNRANYHAELRLVLKVHGKETAVVFPLSMTVQSDQEQDTAEEKKPSNSVHATSDTPAADKECRAAERRAEEPQEDEREAKRARVGESAFSPILELRNANKLLPLAPVRSTPIFLSLQYHDNTAVLSQSQEANPSAAGLLQTSHKELRMTFPP